MSIKRTHPDTIDVELIDAIATTNSPARWKIVQFTLHGEKGIATLDALSSSNCVEIKHPYTPII